MTSIFLERIFKYFIAVSMASSTYCIFSVINCIAPTGTNAAGKAFITALTTLITTFNTLSTIVMILIIWFIVRSKAKIKVIVPSIYLAKLTKV